MKSWGWKVERSQGIWRLGPLWLKPAAIAVPWIMVGLLIVMLNMIGGTLTSAEGVLFDLPTSGISDGEATPLVALVITMPNVDETYVFFDDARYSLGSDISISAFCEHLSERAKKTDGKTLLVMADKAVSCEQLGKVAAAARSCGLERMLFANKRSEARTE